MSAPFQESVLIPDGIYNARLVDRRYLSDTYEIEDPGKPWHGQKVFIRTIPIRVRLRVKHQTTSDGKAVVIQGKVL